MGVVNRLQKGFGPLNGNPAVVQVWTFRIQTYDDRGNPGNAFGVTMRGWDIVGTLENGDWVEISDRPAPGQGFDHMSP